MGRVTSAPSSAKLEQPSLNIVRVLTRCSKYPESWQEASRGIFGLDSPPSQSNLRVGVRFKKIVVKAWHSRTRRSFSALKGIKRNKGNEPYIGTSKHLCEASWQEHVITSNPRKGMLPAIQITVRRKLEKKN